MSRKQVWDLTFALLIVLSSIASIAQTDSKWLAAMNGSVVGLFTVLLVAALVERDE